MICVAKSKMNSSKVKLMAGQWPQKSGYTYRPVERGVSWTTAATQASSLFSLYWL